MGWCSAQVCGAVPKAVIHLVDRFARQRVPQATRWVETVRLPKKLFEVGGKPAQRSKRGEYLLARGAP